MSFVADELLEQALALSPTDRAKVASGLLASLGDDQVDEGDVEQMWSEETERRMTQLTAGEALVLSEDEVRGGLEALRAERSA